MTVLAALARTALGLIAAGALGLCPASLRAADVPVPALTGRVVDLTGALSTPDRQAIEAKLAAFEQKKGSQVAVLVMPSLGGETIEDFATRVTDRWKLGRAGVDDGVLLLVAMQERRMRIQVGTGVEGALTDALSKRIIAEQMTPLFRAGDFPGGINAGVDGILAAVSGEALPPPRAKGKSGSGKSTPILPLVAVGLLVTPFLAMILRELMGRFFGAAAAGGLVGGAVFLFAGILLAAVVAGAIVFFFTIAMEPLPAVRGGRGKKSGWDWVGTTGGSYSSGASWGGGSGGGGFSGGGGGFSGGGASGSW